MNGWIVDCTKTDVAISGHAPTSRCSFGDDIPHRRHIATQDIVFFRSAERLVRVSRVDGITITQTDKETLRCPACGSSQIVLRQTQSPAYRCVYGHKFVDPAAQTGIGYERIATFLPEHVDVVATIEAVELRPFELTNSPTLSLRPCDLNGLARYVARRDRNAKRMLRAWLKGRPLALTDADADNTDLAEVLNEREIGVLLRRGSKVFRDELIRVYGPRCMISGCTVGSLLEAVCIPLLSSPKGSNLTNGLLLRSDIHTLFDLNMIGINPDRLTVALHPDLAATEYSQFMGSKLLISAGNGPNRRALEARWQHYLANLLRAPQHHRSAFTPLRDHAANRALQHNVTTTAGDSKMI